MVKDSGWDGFLVVDNSGNGVTVECTYAITLDLEALLITLGNYSDNIIPREGQVVDAVEGVDEVI